MTVSASRRRVRAALQADLRFQVRQRDHGICKRCGLDCLALEKRLRLMDAETRRLEKLRLGIPDNRDSLWDCHHVLAVSEGGMDVLENSETRCLWCHAKATATLTSDLAHARAAGRAQTALERIFG